MTDGVKVLCFGVWDLLHVGHVDFLERASAYGKYLIVGCPSDETVTEDKGVPPVIPFADRVRMLRSLRCVSRVIGYTSLEFLTPLREVLPDVLAVGGDWGCGKRHFEAERWCRDNGVGVVRLPRYGEESTSGIKRRVREAKSERGTT